MKPEEAVKVLNKIERNLPEKDWTRLISRSVMIECQEALRYAINCCKVVEKSPIFQPPETFMGYSIDELKQIINFAQSRGFKPESRKERNEIKYLEVRISPSEVEVGVIKLSIRLQVNTTIYNFQAIIVKDDFESLFSRLMKRAEYEIRKEIEKQKNPNKEPQNVKKD